MLSEYRNDVANVANTFYYLVLLSGVFLLPVLDFYAISLLLNCLCASPDAR